MQRTLRIALAAVCLLSVASAGAAQGDGGTFTAQDYIEIQQLYAKYAQTLDLGDPEGWANTFTADGVFGETVGHEALKAFAAGFFTNFDGAARHWNSQLIVTPTAEGADGGCYLLLVDTRTQPAGLTVAGIYEDKLVKTPAGWRFQERVFTADQVPAGDQ